MKAIDRLGWAAGISFLASGLRIGIRTTRAEVLKDTLEHLPPDWKQRPSPVVDHLYSLVVGGSPAGSRIRRYHLLYAGPARLGRGMDLGNIFEILRSNLQLFIAENARRRLFVHAGVVGWQGGAILLPGRSCAGKTTLVAALLEAGATYYSDEYALLDPRGRVHPYPLALSIPRGKNGSKERVQPQTLKAAVGGKPLPVSMIAVTEYQRGKKWRPRTISPGRAALALLTHTASARRRPESALNALRQAVAGTRVVRSPRGEAKEVAQWLLQNGAPQGTDPHNPHYA